MTVKGQNPLLTCITSGTDPTFTLSKSKSLESCKVLYSSPNRSHVLILSKLSCKVPRENEELLEEEKESSSKQRKLESVEEESASEDSTRKDVVLDRLREKVNSKNSSQDTRQLLHTLKANVDSLNLSVHGRKAM
ncbi:hypothetical protein AC249_AIPGENE4188 [Exaiptasia diaphana]|nr:hypothetical protein AC249_AIPGENE4188 [Exaiptasia diaphana]